MTTGTEGCYHIKGLDVDSVFATNFRSDDCISALWATQAKFSPLFPGWALYRRVIIGDNLLDRDLKAYAIGMARAVARATKESGRQVVGRKTRSPSWIAQAGLDGLDFGLFGKYPCGVDLRAGQFSVSNKPYQRVRDAVGEGLWIGIATFQSELHANYWRIKSRQKYLGQ